MKKLKIDRIFAVILALLMLASCAPAASGGSGSSNIANGEGNKPSISSAASIETNAENVSSSPKKEEDGEKEEQNTSKQPSTDKENVSSEVKRPVITSRPGKETSSQPSSQGEPNGVTSSIKSNEETSSQDSIWDELSKRKYVMLDDNPAPIKVHRDDAHVPTPLSFTDTLQEDGEIIEFRSAEGTTPYNNKDRYIAIVDTYDDLKTIYKGEIRTYHQEYFIDKALIMLFIEDGEFDAKQEIKSITHKDGRMCIHLKNTAIGYGYMIDDICILIEISKDDLKNINDIVVYEEKHLNYHGKYDIEKIYRDKVYYG